MSDETQSTVVINLADFQKLKEEKQKQLEQGPESLEFLADTQDNSQAIYLFDFDQKLAIHMPYYQNLLDEAHIIDDLKKLNELIKTGECQLLGFCYDQNAKSTNKLLSQINKKYPQLKTFIIAKGLNHQKAKAHQKTPSGAKGYFSDALENSQIIEMIREV